MSLLVLISLVSYISIDISTSVIEHIGSSLKLIHNIYNLKIYLYMRSKIEKCSIFWNFLCIFHIYIRDFFLLIA